MPMKYQDSRSQTRIITIDRRQPKARQPKASDTSLHISSPSSSPSKDTTVHIPNQPPVSNTSLLLRIMTRLAIPTTATVAQKLPTIVAGLYLHQHNIISLHLAPKTSAPEFEKVVLCLNTGDTKTGLSILQFFGMLDAEVKDGSESERRCHAQEMESWISKSPSFATTDDGELEAPFSELNIHLATRPCIVESNSGVKRFSVADMILWASIRANRCARREMEGFGNVVRWFRGVLEEMEEVRGCVEECMNGEVEVEGRDGEWRWEWEGDW
ncbi:hypothetical protein K505DRAFT_361971 [Melanomma pulvis-pyrius CBS 109.77]|uniref:Uncharacterized protein n=1 Tax=Melanomma pulvis-pyrius CBS 109.77 TaxID=1314802 RepID=A0A6A6XAL2_9PLEO|nr:hypothetical protein K505DRAFT_361971 [Melanomma pulvis-pyrius CBS 109.77]